MKVIVGLVDPSLQEVNAKTPVPTLKGFGQVTVYCPTGRSAIYGVSWVTPLSVKGKGVEPPPDLAISSVW